LEGYAAYGFIDEEMKYGLGGQHLLGKDPRQLIGAYYKKDIEQLGQSQSGFRQDNALLSLARRNPALKLTLVEEFRLSYEREWFNGFTNVLSLKHRSLFPRGELPFLRSEPSLQDPAVVNSIVTTEVAVNARFAYKEKFVSGDFRRVSLGTLYPILETQLALGIPGLLQGDYSYQKAIARVYKRTQLGAFGFMRTTLEGGRMWGTLPFPLLIVHNGNETFYYDDNAYNTMNFFEFVSDRYASVAVENHFGGYLFNKVPLLRKLKWREVTTIKAVWGDLEAKHLREMELLPTTFVLDNGPFAEASLGVENILKVLRVDVIRRLTYQNNPNVPLFAIRGKLIIDF
jgi:Family of unknown function (DUF5686)